MSVSVKSLKGVLLITAITFLGIGSVSAQNVNAGAYTKTKVTVMAADNKTNIAITNFPKLTRVVVFDSENNLISIISTNELGAASITVPTSVKNTIYVKTLNGEISASNKIETKDSVERMANKETPASNKA